MKQVFKTLDVDTKQLKERGALSAISSAKDKLIGPEEFLLNATGDFRQRRIGEIYQEYQKQLKKNNAMDFDDLIVKTVELFQNNPDVLSYYQERFKYIMVDEYQDTNLAQFKLISLLAAKYKNLCVVGDDDQSIYKFRGANIENILNFEDAFPGARVIKLEQNYRSTQNILNAANGVIRHNRGRKDKTLWTANSEGTLVHFKQFENARDEADYVARQIRDSGFSYQDQAVLYRTNAQSRLLEERCIYYNVPYRLVGGVNFYQRKEIKDILAYLRTIANGVDDLSVLRIINVPKRGIGATTMGRVTIFASEHGMSLYDALKAARQVPGLGKAASKIEAFVGQIDSFKVRANSEDFTIQDLIEGILDETGYRQELEAEGDESENRATLMTLHSAKGLEFPKVYLVGMEDGLFPSMMSITADDKSEIEEERRLCYVGITRAREELVMTSARQRMVNGETRYSKPSQFVEELPASAVEFDRLEPALSGYGGFGGGSGSAGGSGRKTDAYADDSLPWNQGGMKAQPKAEGRGFGSSHNPYASRNTAPAPASKPAFGKAFTVQKQSSLDYGPGDRVSHIKFGQGTVKSVEDGAKDYEVTVEFDKAGQKKMFASFAKLKKI